MQWSVRQRLWVLMLVATSILCGLVIYLICLQKDQMMEDRRTKTLNVVELAYGILDHYGKLQQSGQLDEATARQAAQDAVANLRYDGDNYVSIYDQQYRMVRHPAKPELNGKNLNNLKDSKGTLIVVGVVDAANRQKNEFTEYLWPKAGSDIPIEKIAIGKLYAPWGWVVSSGIYVDDVNAEFQHTLLLSGACVLAGLILLWLVSWNVVRSVSLPLEELCKRIRHVTTHNDLTTDMRVSGVAEVNHISAAFSTLLERFRGIIGQVRQGTEEVLQSSASLAGTARVIERTTSEQSHAAQTVAATTEEISASIARITESIDSVATLAQHSRDQTGEGRNVVQQAAREMENIANTVGRSADAVLALGEQSRKISDIVSAIREIADQTNLLALNAAIEAARAGESGRGFAVVADEVRKLAERTAKSTQEIGGMISSIQQGTSQAVDGMQGVSRVALEGVQLTRSAGDAVGRIDESTSSVSSLISDVALAAAEQRQASQEIARNIENISHSADTNAHTVSDMAAAATQLESMAGRLREEVAIFRV